MLGWSQEWRYKNDTILYKTVSLFWNYGAMCFDRRRFHRLVDWPKFDWPTKLGCQLTDRNYWKFSWKFWRLSYLIHRMRQAWDEYLKWCLHRRQNIKCCCCRQQWRFEKMGRFLLKSHRSAKRPDPHRLCKRTFMFEIGMIDQIMRYLIVVVLWQLSHER